MLASHEENISPFLALRGFGMKQTTSTFVPCMGCGRHSGALSHPKERLASPLFTKPHSQILPWAHSTELTSLGGWGGFCRHQ